MLTNKYTSFIKWVTKPYQDMTLAANSKDREIATKAFIRFIGWYALLLTLIALFGGE